MSLNNSASTCLILVAVLCLLSACASTPTSKRDFATENYVKNHMDDSGSYNTYPLKLLVGPISTSQFGSVDVENNIAATLNLTGFGEMLRDDLAANISRAGNFEAVSKYNGGIYLEGNVLELIPTNSFACGGTMVEAAIAVSMLSYRGGEVLWEKQYRHKMCFQYIKYDFSRMEYWERYVKAFSLLSKTLSQRIADDIGRTTVLMNATENVLGVSVYSAEQRAVDHRRETERAAEQKRMEKERTAEQKRIEEQRKQRIAAKKIAEDNQAAAIKAEHASESGLLNVIGIHPGISTEDQFKSKKELYGYVIGGYELLCVGKFEAFALYSMTCLTGKESLSKDRVSGDKNRLVANTEVHEVLREGFQRKLGAPQALTNQIRNGFGAKFQQEILSWTDTVGNKLTLFSVVGDLKTGTLSLESSKAVEDREREEREADAQREF